MRVCLENRGVFLLFGFLLKIFSLFLASKNFQSFGIFCSKEFVQNNLANEPLELLVLTYI